MTELLKNALKYDKSPYLLAHANNPIHWQIWGQDALERAQTQDKMIFISIGYATCHWCHVMEKESFNNLHIANLLNQYFIPIKLDREERPDLDAFYMLALQISGQQGGWPLNMFLTPSGHPITGGTYFPPQPAMGLPSFENLLKNLIHLWQKDKEKLLTSATTLMKYIRLYQTSSHSREKKSRNSAKTHDLLVSKVKEKKSIQVNETCNVVVDSLIAAFDAKFGGFIFVATSQIKFPELLQILFLTKIIELTNDQDKKNILLQICAFNIASLKHGGIYDQIGGGIARYSTDRQWLIPHFEKMLYDNALYLWCLAKLYHLAKKYQLPLYRKENLLVYLKKEKIAEWIEEQIGFLFTDFSQKDGCFISAIDADSEGSEGKFYLWRKDEIQKILKKHDYDATVIDDICTYWHISDAGNFSGGTNILVEPLSSHEFADTAQEKTKKSIHSIRKILYQQRKKRENPLIDDKIIGAWNALGIIALVQVAKDIYLDNKRIHAACLQRAKQVGNHLWQYLFPLHEGQLKRRWREQHAAHNATLSDYANLSNAYLDLFEITQDIKYLQYSLILTYEIFLFFPTATGDGFYESSILTTDIVYRQELCNDGVEPSGISMICQMLHRLACYGYDLSQLKQAIAQLIQTEENFLGQEKKEVYEEYESQLLSFENSFLQIIETIFQKNISTKEEGRKNQSYLLKVYAETHLTKAKQIIITTGENKSTSTINQCFDFIYRCMGIPSIFALVLKKKSELDIIPIVRGKDLMSNQELKIWVCSNFSCKHPVSSFSDAWKILES